MMPVGTVVIMKKISWISLVFYITFIFFLSSVASLDASVSTAALAAISTSTNENGFTLNDASKTAGVEYEAKEMPVDEQEQIDTMVRAFERLPAPELDRLGVDVTSPIKKGSNAAEQLKKAWENRQKELKEAMASVLKPAEFMGDIAKKLRDPTTDDATILDSLKELEGLLADIDNARDFHTIGGWKVLVKLLEEQPSSGAAGGGGRHRPIEQLTLAAWAVGTAVKNSYDYQLWMLEPSTESAAAGGDEAAANFSSPPLMTTMDSSSCLPLLVSLLDNSLQITNVPGISTDLRAKHDELQRRALYAISSAVRGNTDIQEALLSITTTVTLTQTSSPSSSEVVNQPAVPVFTAYLQSVAEAVNSTSPELTRKVWALVADMLQERAYIRTELMYSSEIPKEAQTQLLAMRLLGDEFATVEWAALVSVSLRQLYLEYTTVLESSGVKASRAADDVEDEDRVVLLANDDQAITTDSDNASSKNNITTTGTTVTISYLSSLRATIDSLLIALGEITAQAPRIWTTGNDQGVQSRTDTWARGGHVAFPADLREIVRGQIAQIASLEGDDRNEGLTNRAKDVLVQFTAASA